MLRWDRLIIGAKLLRCVGEHFYMYVWRLIFQKHFVEVNEWISIRHNHGVVSSKYECLPIICYWCGEITHDDRECEVWLTSKGSL